MAFTFPTTFPTPDVWLVHRVSYGETDAMGMVYNGEYLHLFERSRSEFCRNQGMSYVEVEERGIRLPVREASCRYRHPARYDDLIWIRAGVAQWSRASIIFVYEVHDEAKERILATGHTQHACVDASMKPVPIPDWFRQAYS